MKWIYGIQQKYKTASMFMVVVITIIGCNLLEKKFFADINESVSSIYKDRLIPAAELFHANDIMYKKRLLLEKFLANPAQQPVVAVKQQLTQHNAQIDSIVQAYEASYLVDEESTSLQHFKKRVQEYNKLEGQYLATTGELSADAYEKGLSPIFKEIHQDLVQLSQIQTSVGKDLLNGSRHLTNGVNLLSYLQIAIVVVILISVNALLLSTRTLIPKNLKNFRLN